MSLAVNHRVVNSPFAAAHARGSQADAHGGTRRAPVQLAGERHMVDIIDSSMSEQHFMPVDYDPLAQQYARHRRVHPAVLMNLMSTGSLDGESRVLEVGCGTGNYIVALQELTGCLCWAAEPSAQMLVNARHHSRSIHLAQGRAEQLHYAAGSFDLVFSVDVIHHVVDPSRYFDEAHRVLSEGGRFCTVTDSEGIIRQRQPLSVYFPETAEVDLQRYPPMAQLRELLTGSGFAELREEVVEHAYALRDIRAYRDQAYSSLHLISPEAFVRGIRRMEQHLESGPIQGVSRYCLLWGTRRRRT
jgi:ubiquinone/menaquinone biosynthesis C-methylase UbiE